MNRHPEMAQDPGEFDALLLALDILEPTSILEVGVLYGGVMSRLQDRYPGIMIVGIDPHPMIQDASYGPQFGKGTAAVVQGCSQDRSIRQRAESYNFGERFDVALIDGDHSYESVRDDWLWARREIRRLVAFHDVGPHAEFGTRLLWTEIRKARPRTCVEIFKDPNGYHGWGLVYLP